VPVPDEPYPHANDSSKLARVAKVMVVLKRLPVILLAILVIGVLFRLL